MGKCVDQVYFMEKGSKRQGLKIGISQQFSYAKWREGWGRMLHPLLLFRTVSDL